MLIAYCTQHQPCHGQVTAFARKYAVSRQTIYNIKASFTDAVAPVSPSYTDHQAWEKRLILSLRLEGQSPLSGIKKVLKRLGAVCDSVGYISETLTEWGQIAGTDLGLDVLGETIQLPFAADEIYAGSQPILVVVDPRSLAILRITLCADRSSASWEAVLNGLTAQHIRPSLIVKDDGTGMDAAFGKVMPDIDQQTDTFHAVAHRLGEYKHRYERAAYHAIKAEYDAEAQYYKAKSPDTRQKYYERYCSCWLIADAAIALYDHFCFLYHTLLNAFQLFDTHGNLKNTTTVLADFEAALDLMTALQHPNLKQMTTALKSIHACQPKLFTFLRTAQTVVQTLAADIPAWILQPFCRAWQAHKNNIKAKNIAHKNACKTTENAALTEAESLQPNSFYDLKTRIYTQLNTIIQSSAAVECINSILRPYLNTARNHISQDALNLFQFYHNHRVFEQGERKGKSPMQILTGNEHHDWITLLTNKNTR
jgi:hypothetical protein